MKLGRFYLMFILAFSSIFGVLRRHDVEDYQFQRFGLDPSFLHVGMVECSNGRGTGTLIDPRTVLTAAHVTGDCKTAYFTLYNHSGLSKKVIRGEVMPHFAYFQHKYLGSTLIRENSNDLAMIRLKERVDDIIPGEICYSPQNNPVLCYSAGFGYSGTGLDDEWENDHQKRGFTNILEGNYPWDGNSRYLQISFDSPENPSVTHLEGMGAFGDSGGPIFVDIENKKQLIGVISMLTLEGAYGAKNLLIPVEDYKDWIEENRFTKYAFLSGQSCNWDDKKTWIGERVPQNKRFAYYEVLLDKPISLKMENNHTIDFLKITHKDAYLELLRPLFISKLEIIDGSIELSHDGLGLAKIHVEGPAQLGGSLFINAYKIPYEEGDQVTLIEAESIKGRFKKIAIDTDIECHLLYTPTKVKLIFKG